METPDLTTLVEEDTHTAEKIKYMYSSVLNDLDAMAHSMAYAARRATIRQAEQAIVALENRNQDQAKALELALDTLRRIAQWTGEFPEVKDSNGKKCSYAYLYGSNGERDFMRDLAYQTVVKITTPK